MLTEGHLRRLLGHIEDPRVVNVSRKRRTERLSQLSVDG